MSRFRFNVGKTNEQLYYVRKSIDNYKKKYERTYSDVKNIRNVWNDPGSEVFNKIVDSDEKNISEVIESLYTYQKNLETFCNDLGSIISRYGYRTNNMNIIFDGDRLNTIISELQNIKVYMNRSIDAFATCLVPYGYEYKYVIDRIYGESYRILNLANSLQNDLYNIRSSVEGLVNDTRYKNNNTNFITLDGPMTRVGSPVVSVITDTHLDLKKDTKASINNTHYQSNNKTRK